MALKVKAVQRLLKFDKESAGKYRYVMKADLYTSLTQVRQHRHRPKVIDQLSDGVCFNQKP